MRKSKRAIYQSNAAIKDIIRTIFRAFNQFIIIILKIIDHNHYNIRLQLNNYTQKIHYRRAFKRLKLKQSEKRYINI